MQQTRSTNTGKRRGTCGLIGTLLNSSHQSRWNTTDHDLLNILMALWEGFCKMTLFENQGRSCIQNLKDSKYHCTGGQIELSELRFIQVGIIHRLHVVLQNQSFIQCDGIGMDPNDALLSVVPASGESSIGEHKDKHHRRNLLTRFAHPQHPTDKIKVSYIIFIVDK